MRNFCVLTDAISFIEANLEGPLAQEAIAAHCYCSLSSLQKLFRYAVHLSVKDYIERRRLTQAAHTLLDTEGRVTDVALRYQYQSPEVFARAFRRLWGTTPSEFRRTWRFAGLFPKVEGLYERGDGIMSRRVDISQLYDALREAADTYVLCFDIQGLMPINEIGRGAGDLAIRTCLKRLDDAATDDMLLFRVGGDEFALVTRLHGAEEARALGAKVLADNGRPIVYEGREIPLSMYAVGMKMRGGNLRYAELFDALQDAMTRYKRSGDVLVLEEEEG